MSVDLDKVTNLPELKAYAYDQIKAIEQAQANLAAINHRIAELEAAATMGNDAAAVEE